MVRTLEFYGYHETNDFVPALKPCNYKVKVSDKDGNIITIEDDGALLAMVGLKLENGVLSLTDAARGNVELASVDFPSADKIKGLEYKDGFIILSYSDAYTGQEENLQIDVTSLIDIYEAGAGLQMDESADGKKKFSIRLSESNDSDALKIDEQGGLKFDGDKFATDIELADAISGKADVAYVDEKFNSLSGLSEDINDKVSELGDKVNGVEQDLEHVKRVIGTDEESPSIKEQIDSTRESIDSAKQELQGGIDAVKDSLNVLSGVVESQNDTIGDIQVEIGKLQAKDIEHDTKIADIEADVEAHDGRLDAVEASVNDLETVKADKTELEAAKVALQNSIDEEAVKRAEADNALEAKLLHEASLRFEADNKLREAIAEEADARAQGDDDLLSKINDEISARTESDNSIIAQLNKEIQDRKDADVALRNDLNEAKTELAAADTVLAQRISDETQERANGDAALRSDLDAEIARSTAKDEELVQAIEDETARANEAESALTESIDAEKEARQSADESLRSQIEAETTRATNAEDALDRKIDSLSGTVIADLSDIEASLGAEIAERKANDSALTADIATETAARLAEDARIESALNSAKDDLQDAIKAEKTRAEEAESGLTAAINTEVERAQNAEQAIQSGLTKYVDAQDDKLAAKISDNATKIAKISELKELPGGVYDNSGNGILDVLHREFHNFTGSTITSGEGIQVSNPNEVALGQYNETHVETDEQSGQYVLSGCTAFSIGIGTDDANRKNAIEIMRDGTIYMWVEDDFIPLNKLLEGLSHETY